MLKNENIICLSTIDWDFIWQEHQSTMSVFAKNNNRVLFIENTGVRAPGIKDIPRLRKRISNWVKSLKGFRKEMDNLYVYSPLILPFPYLRIARLINKWLLGTSLKRWMEATEFADPIIWTFLPTPIVLDLVNTISHKAFIYYCTDNLAATSRAARKIVKYEREVVRGADAVFVMSKRLAEYFKGYNKEVVCIPMGITLDRFVDASLIEERVPELEDITPPIVGYMGGVRDSIDQELVSFLLTRFRNFTFVFVGPIQTDISRISAFSNTIFIGQRSHKELYKYIRYFDVSIIPYKKDEYTDNISPAKLNEYLIMGKPVVSTNLEQVVNFNKENSDIIYIADSYQKFADFILKAIKSNTQELQKKRKEIALENSWDKKVEKMSDIVEAVIRRRQERRGRYWRERLLGIYRGVRKRIFRFAIGFSMLWLLLFYTPLIWLIAAPLKIADVPGKADAIVVLGGGVGETGSPGKSTIERARFAAELYKEGYADKLIFSSGYTWVYNDAENMKLVATSLGVSNKDIILEEKANSTYENVMFSKGMLDKNKWRSILLVSSPYNMRRAKLVFNKWGKDIRVLCIPVPKCQFYDRSEGIKLEQIRAIMHEYLGILYYWFRGYL